MNERQDAVSPPPDYSRTRRYLLILIVGVTLLIVVVLQTGSYLAQRRVVVGEYEHLHTHIDRSHRSDVQITLDLYTARARNLLARPEVVDAIRNRDRTRLLSVLANTYSQLLAENPYLDVLHFHGPDNVTLLRMHRPDQFGDDLSAVRPMIAEANRSRRMQSGFEIGKNGISYRVAVPILADGEHLGALELGVAARYFTKRIEDIFHIETMLVFEPEAMAPYFAEHGEIALPRVGRHILLAPRGAAVPEGLADLLDEVGPYAVTRRDGHDLIVYKELVIHNHLGDPVGRVVMMSDVTERIGAIQRFALMTTLGWLVLLLVLARVFDRVFLRMQTAIETQQAAILEQNARLEELSLTDPLTGIGNRRAFFAVVEEEVARSRRYGYPVAIAILDIDHFKKVNDDFGHLTGDDVLRQMVSTLLMTIRAADALYRIGGEEFAILFTHTALDDAKAKAEALRAAVERTDFGIDRTVTVSFGLAEVVEADSVCDLMARADAALYCAKSSGRNRVCADEICGGGK